MIGKICRTCGAFVDGSCDATWVSNSGGKYGPIQIADYDAEKSCWRSEGEHFNHDEHTRRCFEELRAERDTLKAEVERLKEALAEIVDDAMSIDEAERIARKALDDTAEKGGE